MKGPGAVEIVPAQQKGNTLRRRVELTPNSVREWEGSG